MAKTYLFCDSGSYVSTDVTISTSACGFYAEYTSGAGTVKEYRLTTTFTLSVPSTEVLRVYYSVDYENDYWGGGYSNTEYHWCDIPAGVSSYQILPSAGQGQLCIYDYQDNYDERGYEYERWDNWTLLEQEVVPECTPAVGCTLAITGSTLTPPTLRGGTDGSITVAMSGATGATVTYKVNGVTKSGTSPAGNTFTGLAAGSYTVLATEGICFAQETYSLPDGEFRTGDFNVSQPNELSAVENPVMLTLNTAISSSTPKPSKSRLIIYGTISDGDSITITLTYPQAYTATFYAKGFPNRQNYFLASVLTDGAGNNVGTNTASEIATSLAEVISNDTVLSRLYDIRVSGVYIYFVAKENNASLDLDTTTVAISTSNIILYEQQNGVSAYDGQIEANYSLYVDVFVDDDSEYGDILVATHFNGVTQLELPYSQDNVHMFDLSPVLKNFVNTPKINFALTGATTLPSMMAAYYCAYGEKYPLVPNKTTKKARSKGTTDIKYVINSAQEWEDANNMDEYLGEYIHDVKVDFDGTFSGSMGNQTFVFDDIYFDEDVTGNTTNIQYKLTNEEYPEQTFDWQDSNTFNGITSSYPQGEMWISGITSGVTFMYNATWYSNNYGATITNLGTDMKKDIKFLTNAPNPKQVQRNSNEFLYFILKKQYRRQLSVKADLYFYDGTSLTGETLYDIPNSSNNYGGVYCVPSGYEQLGLEDYETYSGGTRKIRRVDFAVYQEDAAGVDVLLTESRSYRYEIDEQPRRFGVAFLNKRGTWDVFDFSGEIIDSVTHSNEAMEVPRTVGLDGASPKGFEANTIYGTSVLRKHTCNSGWIDEEHFDWLIELLSSNKIYNYTDDEEPFLIVETVTYEKSSNDDLYQIDVVFTETLADNNVKV